MEDDVLKLPIQDSGDNNVNVPTFEDLINSLVPKTVHTIKLKV